MRREHILKDLDNLCSNLIICLKSSQQLITEKRINNFETVEKMTHMVVDLGSLLLELQQSKAILCGEKERVKTIVRLTSSCKNLEGMIKEMRNDLLKRPR